MDATLPRDLPEDVAAAFAAFPPGALRPALEARALIREVAAADPRIGPLTEALRWGEPAYLTLASGSGSTLRLGVSRTSGCAAIFLNCRTGLVEAVRDRCGPVFRYVAAREIGLPPDLGPVRDAVRLCAALALTHHLRRRAG